MTGRAHERLVDGIDARAAAYVFTDGFPVADLSGKASVVVQPPLIRHPLRMRPGDVEKSWVVSEGGEAATGAFLIYLLCEAVLGGGCVSQRCGRELEQKRYESESDP